MKWNTIILIGLVTGFTMGNAAERDKNQPGYIDLSGIDITETSEEIEIPAFSWVSGKDDSKGQCTINIKSFEFDSSQTDRIRKKMNEIEKKMKKDQWKSIIQVKKGDEWMQISVKFDENTQKTVGLLMMKLEPEHEATFVNLFGSFPLNALESLDVDDPAIETLKDIFNDQDSDETEAD
ncbi:DUF4252 domain-containing protein [bacterium]|nr:DUF4252 domain-containing protein [bacterium]